MSPTPSHSRARRPSSHHRVSHRPHLQLPLPTPAPPPSPPTPRPTTEPADRRPPALPAESPPFPPPTPQLAAPCIEWPMKEAGALEKESGSAGKGRWPRLQCTYPPDLFTPEK